MTLHEVIEDLHALQARTQAYERKYGVTSQDFLALYRQGLLSDEGLEQSTEYVRWASAYEIQMDRQAEFEARSRSFIAELRQRSDGLAVRLGPNPQLMQT